MIIYLKKLNYKLHIIKLNIAAAHSNKYTCIHAHICQFYRWIQPTIGCHFTKKYTFLDNMKIQNYKLRKYYTSINCNDVLIIIIIMRSSLSNLGNYWAFSEKWYTITTTLSYNCIYTHICYIIYTINVNVSPLQDSFLVSQ